MEKSTCPRRQEVMERPIQHDRTLPPTSEDIAHAASCAFCKRALRVAGALDQDLSASFAMVREAATSVTPGLALQSLIGKPTPSSRGLS